MCVSVRSPNVSFPTVFYYDNINIFFLKIKLKSGLDGTNVHCFPFFVLSALYVLFH